MAEAYFLCVGIMNIECRMLKYGRKKRIMIWKKEMSKEKEMIERNIELSAEFSRYLFEHTEIEEKIPFDSEIILLPEFDEELKEFNLRMGKDIEANGGIVVYVSIKELRPKSLSRIERIELESLV